MLNFLLFDGAKLLCNNSNAKKKHFARLAKRRSQPNISKIEFKFVTIVSHEKIASSDFPHYMTFRHRHDRHPHDTDNVCCILVHLEN